MSEAGRLARAWIEIWDRGDPATLPLADDFVHVSPFGKIEGRGKYLQIVQPMARDNVVSLDIRDVIEEGNRACVAFLMKTPSGPVDCCDWVTVADGRIKSVHSYYDSRNLPRFEKY